jgi:hypothetical protein
MGIIVDKKFESNTYIKKDIFNIIENNKEEIDDYF